MDGIDKKEEAIDQMIKAGMILGLTAAADMARQAASKTQNLQEQVALKRFATALEDTLND